MMAYGFVAKTGVPERISEVRTARYEECRALLVKVVKLPNINKMSIGTYAFIV